MAASALPSVVAVVLGAGRGSRMGGPKALLRIGGQSFLAHVAAALRRPGVSDVVAVVGHEAERVIAESGLPADVHVVRNPRYDEGMLTSIWCGLDAARDLRASAILLHPVDHPLISAATVDRVLSALAHGARIAAPSQDGRRGHPGGFAAASWDALRAASLTEGARRVLAEHPEWIVHVEGDPGCLQGVDTPADFARLFGHPPA